MTVMLPFINSLIRNHAVSISHLHHLCNKIALNIFKGILKHRLFLIIMVITIVVQILITQFGGVVFKTAPLNGYHWLASVGISLLSLPIGNTLKLRKKRSQLPIFISFLSLNSGLVIRLIPLCCTRPAPPPPPPVTREKLLWEGAIKQVQMELRVVQSFRGGRYKKF